MLTLRGGIKRLQLHGQLPSSNIMSVRDLRQHFQFSPRNSIKSMLTAMYASIGGWSMPDQDQPKHNGSHKLINIHCPNAGSVNLSNHLFIMIISKKIEPIDNVL